MATPRRSSRFQARELEVTVVSDVLRVRTSGGKRKRAVDDVEYTPQIDSPRVQTGGTKALKKTRLPKPEPIFIIPDVPRKETTFKGRLGYACLNTVLRNKKPAKDAVFCSRTCRSDWIVSRKTAEWVKDLGRQNVEDLLTMIQWNEENHIHFMRMSSDMFPFASHAVHGYSLEYCAPLLAKYTQLGSPKPEVVVASVRELEYHCEMMDRMGLGVDSVMIIHGGGMYDDKTATLGRIKKTITEDLSPGARARLVLENDEMCYNAHDLLPLCEELDVPLVFDYHHDALFPSSIPPSEIIKRANAIWARRGIKPKQHLRAHADRCESLPADLPENMDLMIEAKDKEQAVLQLYRMYGLHPVKHESLRPPDENQTKETKGRKSSKKQKTRQAREEEEEEEEEDQ
ncbi:UV-endonuclease UvdE-domain-containing protein [Mycena haematopus]|nr:UV-endonuclease UvdE-domain-containing protein [Mycena haematopus]